MRPAYSLPSYRSDPHTGGRGIYVSDFKALVDLGHHVDVISGPPYPILDTRVGLIKLPSLDIMRATTRLPVSIAKFSPTRPICLNGGAIIGAAFLSLTFGVRMADYMRDKIDQYDIMHDNQTLCYGMLDVRDMGLPVVNIHHPSHG